MRKGEHMSEEQKAKQRGKNNPFYGKHHSKETKEYLSLINTGKKVGPRSEETRKRMSIAGKNKHTTISEEERKRRSEFMKGKVGPLHPAYGTKRTIKSKALMSEKAKARCTAEWKERNRIINKNRWLDDKYRESHSGKNHPGWKGGVTYEPYCPLFNNKFKEYIRDKFDRKCFYCGKSESDNITSSGIKQKLSVHHVDYDKVDICNGRSWPFVPLCITCHNKTNNGSRWYWFNKFINYWILDTEKHITLNMVMFDGLSI